MAEKTLKTRIIQKRGTEAEWKRAIGFIPLKGEIIVYEPDENYDVPRLKIGDGVPNADGVIEGTNVNDLPFIGVGQATPEGGEIFNDYTNNIASNVYSHAEGQETIAAGACSHAEGYSTEANGDTSHAEGYNTIAAGDAAHAEGVDTEASGWYSHAEGEGTKASGYCSHTSGQRTRAAYEAQFAIGQYNNNKEETLFEIGNGENDTDRSNAFEVYKDGHAEVKTVGTTDKSVVTKKYVDDLALNSGSGANLDDYVKKTDKAGVNQLGLVQFKHQQGINIDSNGYICTSPASDALIEAKENYHAPIVPARLDKAVKVGVTTNTIALTADEKQAAQTWLGTTSKEYIDGINPIKHVSYEVNDTKLELPNELDGVEGVFKAKLKANENIYNFSNTINPSIDNRVYTTEFYRLNDVQEVLLAEGFKTYYHLYDENYAWVAKSGWHNTNMKIAALPTASDRATYFKIVLGTTNDSAIDDSVAGESPLAFKLTNNSSIANQYDASSYTPSFSQGTINGDGSIASNISTRVHLAYLISIKDNMSVKLAPGYKAYLHFYDANGNWIGNAGQWTPNTSSAEMTISMSTIASLNKNAVYINAAIGKTNDANLNPDTANYEDAIVIVPLITTSSIGWSQGTLDNSIISNIVDTTNARGDIRAVDNGDGTVTFNGTVKNTKLSIDVLFSTMTWALTYSKNYTVVVRSKNPTDSQYTPVTFTPYNQLGQTITTDVYSGYMYFTFDTSGTNGLYIPAKINYTAPVGTVFNNTTIYIQLIESRKDVSNDLTSFEWEHGFNNKVDKPWLLVEDNNGARKYTNNFNVSGTCVGPYIAVTCNPGCKIETFDYSVDIRDSVLEEAKAYINSNPAGYVKNTDYATTDKAGVVKVGAGLTIVNGAAQIQYATEQQIENKQGYRNPLSPVFIDKIIKTGVTTNTITLTDAEKQAAQNWLGITNSGGSNIVISDTQPTNPTEGMIWIEPIV